MGTSPIIRLSLELLSPGQASTYFFHNLVFRHSPCGGTEKRQIATAGSENPRRRWRSGREELALDEQVQRGSILLSPPPEQSHIPGFFTGEVQRGCRGASKGVNREGVVGVIWPIKSVGFCNWWGFQSTQYFVGPPSASRTALHLSHQLFTRLSMKSLGTASHASQITALSRSNGMLATSHLISKYCSWM